MKDLTRQEAIVPEQMAHAAYARVAQFKVTDVNSYLTLADLLRDVKKIVNQFEEETRPEIAKAHDLHKSLIARKKKWAAKFEEAEILAKQKLLDFAGSNEVPKADGVIYSETWVGEVVDADALPRMYMKPDIEKLNAITKTLKEATDIPGWKTRKSQTISVRD